MYNKCVLVILFTLFCYTYVNAQEYTRKVLKEPSVLTPEMAFYKEFTTKRSCNLYTIKGDVKQVVRTVTEYYHNGGDDTAIEKLSYIGENRFPKYQVIDHLQPFKYRNTHYKDSTLYKILPSFYTQQDKTVEGWWHNRVLEFKNNL